VPEQLDNAAGKDTVMNKLDAEQFKKDNPNFGIVYNGYINITEDGSYNFALSNYTNTQLFIDGEKLTESEYILPLAKGFHKMEIRYIYNAPVPTPGSYRVRQGPLKVFVTAPGAPKKELDAASIYY
jgi:hexosaminidase